MTNTPAARSSRILAARLRGAALRLRRAIARRERLWLGLSLAAVGFVLAAFAAVHVALARGMVPRWVNSDPEGFLLGYESASSWVPGVVHVRGLTLRGSDPNVQWSARMEDATIQISLWDLLFRRFHVTRLRAQGLTFRLRERMGANEADPAHAALLPAISGFSDPPRRDARVGPAPPAAGAPARYWTVLIENLTADPAPEIWIDIYRFRGQGRVTGSFLIHPHARVWVGPAAVRLLAGDITLGAGQPLLTGSSGTFETVIAPYDPDRVRGNDVWPLIQGAARAHGRLSDLRFLNHFLRFSREPRLHGGGGAATIDLRFLRGIGTGRVDFEAPRVAAAYGHASLTGRAVGHFAIRRWDQQHGELDLSGSRVDFADVATADAAGITHGPRNWWGRFELPEARLTSGLDALARVTCRDARPLYTLLGANLPGWAQGILKLDGLEASARVRLGHGLVDVRGLDAKGGKFHLAGLYRESGADRRGAFLLETGPLAVGVEIAGGASHVKLLGARSWFEGARAAAGAPAGAGS